MAYPKEKREEVKRLRYEGRTQKEIWDMTGVPPRTQRDWGLEGLWGGPPEVTSDKRKSKKIPKTPKYEWPDITASDVMMVGFLPHFAPILISTLAIAKSQGNTRLPRLIQGFIDIHRRWPDMPEAWRSVVAGFPIVAEDISSPSLADVAALVRELHPYKSKELRKEYHKRINHLLVRVLTEVQSFLQDAAMVGWLPLLIIPEGKKYRSWSQRSKERYAYIGDLLTEGRWAFDMSQDYQSGPESAWTSILFDMISRLPDPDRQRGKIMGKAQMFNMVYLWCSTAPNDFKPPLPSIKRIDVSDYTARYKEIYMQWYQKAVQGETAMGKAIKTPERHGPIQKLTQSMPTPLVTFTSTGDKRRQKKDI